MIETFFLQCQNLTPTSSNWIVDKILPSLIGTGTALLVFYLSTRRDKNKEEDKKKEDRTDKVLYLKSLLDNIINVSTQQCKNLVEHIEKIKANSVDFQLMTFVPLTDFKRASETLSKEEYFTSFNKFYKDKIDSTKIYDSLISNIDYLKAQFEEVPEILKKAQEFDYQRKIQYKELVDNTVNLTGSILLKASANMPQVYQDIDKILLNFMQGLNSNSPINYYNDEFVIKLNDYLVSYILTPNANLSDEIMLLNTNTRNARQIFSTIKKANLIVAEDIEEMKILVDSSLAETIKIKLSLS